ncbi:MAG: hypothetical protein KF723_05805 [Rhizobiaceae bacterium]|nr:hypothetical protein [Rhizobiaceae bacterium]
MTLAHDRSLGLDINARSTLASVAAGPLALLRRFLAWRSAVDACTGSDLPPEVRRDIGEVDHLPGRNSFEQASRTSHERFVTKWTR